MKQCTNSIGLLPTVVTWEFWIQVPPDPGEDLVSVSKMALWMLCPLDVIELMSSNSKEHRGEDSQGTWVLPSNFLYKITKSFVRDLLSWFKQFLKSQIVLHPVSFNWQCRYYVGIYIRTISRYNLYFSSFWSKIKIWSKTLWSI